ncbi:MAG: hypothetical protein ACT4OD_05485 [Candidatus Nitrosotenuis sp.]
MIKNIKPTTESATFRLNSIVLNKLSSRAELQKTSLNVLVNQVLSNYVEWEMDAAKAGWILTQRQVLSKLIDTIDEKTVLAVAEKVAESGGKDSILYMSGKYDLDGLLSNIRISAQRSGFSIKEYANERNLEMIVQHDLGWKWSLFFKHYYQKILHDLKQKSIFDYTETTLVINLVEN